MSPDTARLRQLDKQYIWHPFTHMRQWIAGDPLVITSAEGMHLIDSDGNRYLDGVSSLWCNVHGHRVAAIDDAIRAQLDKVAHSTMLGLSNEPAILLAERLMRIVPRSLKKIFYSDSGATATEVAFKLAAQYWYNIGQPLKNEFVGFAEAYHGDTLGAMSVGRTEAFHRPYFPLLFKVHYAPTPFVYRYAFGDAGAEQLRLVREEETRWDRHSCLSESASGGIPAPRADSRRLDRDKNVPALADARQTGMSVPPPTRGTAEPAHERREQLRVSNTSAKADPGVGDDALRRLEQILAEHAHKLAAVCIEPIVQGAAGMIVHPEGFLRGVRELCNRYDVLMIADEVAVGFGRTGKMFACEHEAVEPDLMCVAKGITGGYLPLAATFATQKIFDTFLGEPWEGRTFFHGHTYTGNPLAGAAALASLDLFEKNDLVDAVGQKSKLLAEMLEPLRDLPHVGDIRQKGFMVGIELVADKATKRAFDPKRRVGAEVCLTCRKHGVIIRPLGDVIVLMPPLAMGMEELGVIVQAVRTEVGKLCDD